MADDKVEISGLDGLSPQECFVLGYELAQVVAELVAGKKSTNRSGQVIKSVSRGPRKYVDDPSGCGNAVTIGSGLLCLMTEAAVSRGLSASGSTNGYP